MTPVQRLALFAGLAGISVLGAGAHGNDPGFVETDLVVNKQVGNVPTLTDGNGIVHIAKVFDPHLVNPWGISESQTSPFWVSDNGDGTSALFSTAGQTFSTVGLLVSIPSPADPAGNGGTPTGQVFDIVNSPGNFPITGVSASGTETTQPAVFIFATEDGTIAGWNPGVFPLGVALTAPSTHAIIAVNNSDIPDSCHGAVYKGLAIATGSGGTTRLYAANFRAGTIDVFDTSFKPVTLGPDSFTDPSAPKRFAPFNVVLVGSELFVTYAKSDKAGEDDVPGPGHGFVDVYDLDGNLLRRFASRHELNSPWGVVKAPATFGEFANDILIGNFGNGRINAFDPGTGKFLGALKDPQGHPIVIEGLWALQVGNGGAGGDANTIYFSAGPNDEEDGLFGSLAPQ
ncbi:MAG TPA: TIGR03118 family protein [Thermoanaerobaculia bacterium]|jgi:uncharacterized protein (TIGR03118 family)